MWIGKQASRRALDSIQKASNLIDQPRQGCKYMQINKL